MKKYVFTYRYCGLESIKLIHAYDEEDELQDFINYAEKEGILKYITYYEIKVKE